MESCFEPLHPFELSCSPARPTRLSDLVLRKEQTSKHLTLTDWSRLNGASRFSSIHLNSYNVRCCSFSVCRSTKVRLESLQGVSTYDTLNLVLCSRTAYVSICQFVQLWPQGSEIGGQSMKVETPYQQSPAKARNNLARGFLGWTHWTKRGQN